LTSAVDKARARRDVMLVFGAAIRPSGKPSPTLRRRLEAAVEAAARSRQPLFIVSGAAAGAGRSEAEVMRQTLLERGIPAEAVLAEPRSRDTLEQVRRCAALLDDVASIGRVLVCTSAFHQPRCRLLLRMLGISAEPVPMPGERRALGWRSWLYYACREVAATVWDGFLLGGLLVLGRGRLRP
jgi:uncharacterized SAM-binding protein YcdF (DUF218 family)